MSKQMMQAIAEAMQNECHAQNKQLMSDNGKLTVQDCVNVFMYKKLAEIKLELEAIKEIVRKNNSQDTKLPSLR